MRSIIASTFALIILSLPVSAQMSGNAVYGRERTSAGPNSGNLYVNDSTMLVEASVMAHVAADEYMAVFGVAEDAESVADANTRIDARIRDFIAALRSLNVRADQIAVDFVTQNRTYDFETTDKIARERQVGFRVKKNLIIRYQDKELLDKIVLAASKLSIFDLIKVDYIVRNPAQVRARLLEAASGIVKEKIARYRSLLGLKLGDPVLIQQESYMAYEPTALYQSYTAAESGQVNGGYGNDRFVVQQAQKSATFYYDAVDATGFDQVLNELPVEPSVQFTLVLKVRVAAR